jgi:hypothetical protein
VREDPGTQQQVVPGRVTAEETVESPTANLVLPKGWVRKVPRNVAHPSVKNTEVLVFQNTKSVVVGDLTEGAQGQKLYMKGDGFTTLQVTERILTFAGTALLLAADKMYLFVGIENDAKEIIWYQVGV